MSHEHYDDEIRRTDRANQGGLWAFITSAGFITIGVVILFLAPPTNTYAIAGACTVGGSGITLFSLGVVLRITGTAMSGGHQHYACLEEQHQQMLGRIAGIEKTLGIAAGDDLSERRRNSTG